MMAAIFLLVTLWIVLAVYFAIVTGNVPGAVVCFIAGYLISAVILCIYAFMRSNGGDRK